MEKASKSEILKAQERWRKDELRIISFLHNYKYVALNVLSYIRFAS